MAGFLDTLRGGHGLGAATPDRSQDSRALIVVGSVALAAGLYAWAVFAAAFRYDGVIGPQYNTPGSDWIVFHGAVQAFLDDNLALIADGERFTAFLNERYGWWLSSPLPFHPWLYPPTFLLVLLPFVESITGLVFVSLGLEVLTLLWGPAQAATVPNLVREEQLDDDRDARALPARGPRKSDCG
jgi:hypothetical protein